MLKVKLNQILNDWKNKDFTYRGEAHRILTYQTTDKYLNLATDKHIFTIVLDEVEEFLNEFKQTENTELVEKELPPGINPVYNEVSDLIMENIKELKKNPEYLAQAKVINENVLTIVQLGKLKLEGIKIMGRFGDNGKKEEKIHKEKK